MKKISLVLVLAWVCFARAEAKPLRRLVLIGGGEYPSQAIEKFVTWAGAKQSSILIISWATDDPPGAFERIYAAVKPFSPKEVYQAPSFDEIDKKLPEFKAQLQKCSGVFFTGGDQSRITDVVKRTGIHAILRAKFDEGYVFGGSSAGAAVMAGEMFTGIGDETQVEKNIITTAPGIGFVDHALVDTHFLKRQRQNRIFSVLLTSQAHVGIGLDEGTAITLVDNQLAQVVGPGKVMLVAHRQGTYDYSITFKLPGDRFRLNLW